MQEDKPKNKNKTEVQGLSCLKGFVIGIIVVFMIPMVIAALVFLQILYIEWQRAHFAEIERPFVQEAIREQCSMHDYVADGYFDDSSPIPLPYYDSLAGYRIDCNMINEFWECSCGEGN